MRMWLKVTCSSGYMRLLYCIIPGCLVLSCIVLLRHVLFHPILIYAVLLVVFKSEALPAVCLRVSVCGAQE